MKFKLGILTLGFLIGISLNCFAGEYITIDDPECKTYLYIRPHYVQSQGLFATCNLVLSQIYLFEKGYYGNKVCGMTVNFGKTGFYYDPAKGSNWWEYYFEPIRLGDLEGVKKTLWRPTNQFENEHAWEIRRDEMTINEAHDIIKRHIKVQSYIQEEVDTFVKKRFKDSYVVGVHYRGTDKVIGMAPRVPYKEVRQIIKQHLKDMQVDNYKIFVATDEQQFFDFMKKSFPKKVIGTNAVRSTDNTAVHHTNNNPFQLGKEVVIDSLLLSKCHMLIRTSSNVSLWSTFFSPDMPEMLLSENKKGTE